MKTKLIVASVGAALIVSLTASAKSVYLIADINSSPTPIHAYDIQGDQIVFQAAYDVPYFGGGATGLTIDTDSKTLFVDYEFSNVIQLLDAETFADLGTTTAPGAEEMAGIVYDHDNGSLYAIERYGNKLYGWTYDAGTHVLTPHAGSPFTLTDVGEAFGIALDEVNDLLYVASWGTTIHYFNTGDWSLAGSFVLTNPAISIAIDVTRGYVYTGAAWDGGNYLSRYELGTGTETIVNIGEGEGAMGLSVDPATGLTYVSTGYGGDRLVVFDLDLNETDSEYAGGDPTDVCVPGRDISYNPLGFSKDDGLAEGECALPGDTVTYTICYANPNEYEVTGATITDTLPDGVAFVSASDGGALQAATGDVIIWDIGTIPGGTPETCVTLTVTVDVDIPLGTELLNEARIETEQTPPTTQTELTIVCEVIPPTCDAGGPYVVECQGGVTTVMLDGSASGDPLDSELTYLWEIDCPAASFDDPASPTPTLSLATPECAMTCDVTLTVDSGLSDPVTCTVVIEIVDTVAPNLSCPAESKVECGAQPSNCPDQVTATDNCDPNPVITFSDAAGDGAITRTWTATDDCGNAATCVTVYNAEDTTPPVLVCPGLIQVEAPDEGGVAVDSVTLTVTATDLCDGDVALTDNRPAEFYPVGTTEVTFTATDAAGNTATCTVLVEVFYEGQAGQPAPTQTVFVDERTTRTTPFFLPCGLLGLLPLVGSLLGLGALKYRLRRQR
ncbi:MAG: HYR domain-containing protein [Planctomycetota bacterium]